MYVCSFVGLVFLLEGWHVKANSLCSFACNQTADTREWGKNDRNACVMAPSEPESEKEEEMEQGLEQGNGAVSVAQEEQSENEDETVLGPSGLGRVGREGSG